MSIYSTETPYRTGSVNMALNEEVGRLQKGQPDKLSNWLRLTTWVRGKLRG